MRVCSAAAVPEYVDRERRESPGSEGSADLKFIEWVSRRVARAHFSVLHSVSVSVSKLIEVKISFSFIGTVLKYYIAH